MKVGGVVEGVEVEEFRRDGVDETTVVGVKPVSYVELVVKGNVL